MGTRWPLYVRIHSEKEWVKGEAFSWFNPTVHRGPLNKALRDCLETFLVS